MCSSDARSASGTGYTPVPGLPLPAASGSGLCLCRETERTLAPGVLYRRFSCRTADGLPVEAYALVTAPDAAADILISAAPRGQLLTVPEHAARCGRRVLAAVNAGFFHINTTQLPTGLLIVDGQVLGPLGQDGLRSLFWFGVRYDGRRVISDPDGYPVHEGQLAYAVSGYPYLLRNGQDALTPEIMLPDDDRENRHPRTAVGLCPDNTLVILCADGRSEASAGLSYPEIQQLLLAFGCTEGLNLDGGGSTTLLTASETGQLQLRNTASDPGLRPLTDAILIAARE